MVQQWEKSNLKRIITWGRLSGASYKWYEKRTIERKERI